MSHFACILVIEDAVPQSPDTIHARVESEMAPFMENCCGEPDKIYMKFYDTEDEMLKEYEEGSREMVGYNGKLYLPWDKIFKKKATKKDPFPRVEAPKDLPRISVPFKETYSTFDEFAAEWHGRKERDETYNRYGYWQNPNAKWDWHEIGGRWSGFFKLKKGSTGRLGSQYNFSGELKESKNRADMCFKSEVDFESMRNEMGKEAAKRYDAVHKAIEGTPPNDSWEIVKGEFDLKTHNNLIDKARKVYHAQPRVKAFTEFGRSEEGREMIGFFSGVEEYDVSREQYIQTARNHAAVPFAVLKDGKWYEQGEMGWWGMAHNEKDPETWNSMVNKLYDELPETALLIAVDCHI
jgi:hypothetical protein